MKGSMMKRKNVTVREGMGEYHASRLARHFKDLQVYKLAFDSAMLIFRMTKSLPPDERFSLTSQIRRSSRSVCGNIAEAWRKRRYPQHFLSKLSDADAEAGETEVWIDFAFACEYIGKGDHENLCDRYDHICRQLSLMMTGYMRWCRTDPGKT